MIGPEKLIEILSQQRSTFAEHPEIPPAVNRAIDAVIELVRAIPLCAPHVGLAYDAGIKVGTADALLRYRPALKSGIASIKSGKKGAAKSHAATEQLHEKAIKEYAKHAQAHPTASRKKICDAVSEALDRELKPATIARLIPDPERRRGRGRPRKP